MAELLAVWGIEQTDNAFRAETIRMAERLGAKPGYLAAVMSFETGGTFDPAEPNRAGSGAVGLIQFMPDTAFMLGTSSTKLAQMSAVEQLAWVEKYYRRWSPRNRYQSVGDHYLAVFAPVGVGKPDSYPLPYKGNAYTQNKGLDTDSDGVITVGEATAPVTAIVRAAERLPPVQVAMSGAAAVPGASPRPRDDAAFPLGAIALGALVAVAVIRKPKKSRGKRAR